MDLINLANSINDGLNWFMDVGKIYLGFIAFVGLIAYTLKS